MHQCNSLCKFLKLNITSRWKLSIHYLVLLGKENCSKMASILKKPFFMSGFITWIFQ